MNLSTLDLYKSYVETCGQHGVTPKSAKSFRSKMVMQQAIDAMNGIIVPPPDAPPPDTDVPPPTPPEKPPSVKEMKQKADRSMKPDKLTAGERAKLRRLMGENKVDHKWGERWDVNEARAVLKQHADSKEEGKTQPTA